MDIVKSLLIGWGDYFFLVLSGSDACLWRIPERKKWNDSNCFRFWTIAKKKEKNNFTRWQNKLLSTLRNNSRATLSTLKWTIRANLEFALTAKKKNWTRNQPVLNMWMKCTECCYICFFNIQANYKPIKLYWLKTVDVNSR